MKEAKILGNQFKDSSGSIWTLKITVGSYMRIKDELGIDVTDVISEESWIQSIALSDDIPALMSMIAIILKPEMDNRGISLEEFFDLISADECDSMLAALVGGVVNFTPAHKREPLIKAILMVREKAQIASEKAVLLLEGKSEEMDKALEKKFKSMIQKPLSDLSSEQPE